MTDDPRNPYNTAYVADLIARVDAGLEDDDEREVGFHAWRKRMQLERMSPERRERYRREKAQRRQERDRERRMGREAAA